MTTSIRRRRGYRPPTRSNLPIALLLYKRLSDDREGTELGVTRQDEDLRAWAADTHPDAEVFDGVTSAHPEGYCDNDTSASTRTDTFRQNYERMLADARVLAESGRYSRVMIVAYTSGRLTRRPREYENLIDLAEQCGVEYYYLRSPSFDLNTAAGREIGRQRAARDAGYVEEITELIVRAKYDGAKKGKWSGGTIPFGFDLKYHYKPNGVQITPGYLVINEDQAKAIREAVATILAGGSLLGIAKQWYRLGFTNKKGGPKTPTDVRRAITNGRIAGLSESYGEEMGKGEWGRPVDENDPNSEWCAIITTSELAAVRSKLDPEAFREVNGRLISRRSHSGDVTRKWLGSRLFLCGKPGCTSDMRSTGAGGGSQYCCRERVHLYIADAPAVDQHVLRVVAAIIARHGAGLLAGAQADEREALTKKANLWRAKIKAVHEAFASDDAADGDPREAARLLRTTVLTLTEKLAAVEKELKQLDVPETTLSGIVDAENPAQAFLDATLDRQRSIVDMLVTVTILPGKKGRCRPGERPTLEQRIRIVAKESVLAA